ncbi:MAG: tRNA (adenosine(37)-N6)-dimethylallyltransferase MiaA [Victivallales bacterium]|nr:tRNA (adenosine(37)-N6)-dimethylallyltransferase MiaA [Victivallales bacterium]
MIRSLIVTGPTASGKTHLAVELSRRFNGEIVSADSRQVYRGLDIGTGKDLEEYGSGADAVPYHLIDIVEPNEEFHLFKYLDVARNALLDITSRGRLPVVAGGSVLYVKALLDGYDQNGGAPNAELRAELETQPLDTLIEMLRKEASPALFQRTDMTQKRRVIRSIELARFGETVKPVPLIDDSLVIAPFFDRKTIHARIEKRLDERLAAGMLEEVQHLHEQGMSWERMDWLGLEYRFAAKALTGELTIPQMRDMLLAHIRQFCKHQDGWFRKLERDGRHIHWIREGNLEEAAALVAKWLAGEPLPEPTIRLNNIRYN